MFFSVENGSGGNRLWVSEGTAATTRPLNNRQWSPISEIVDMNGIALFIGVDSAGRSELWQSDGTEAGTSQIVVDGKRFRDVNGLTVAGTQVFFREGHGNSASLWTLDDTFQSKIALASNTSSQPVAVGDEVMFAANANKELWKSDGTTTGTVHVKDFVRSTVTGGPSSAKYLTESHGKLYFAAAENPNADRELWVSDGTRQGTMPTKQVISGPVAWEPSSFIETADGMVFKAEEAGGVQQLWKLSSDTNALIRLTDLKRNARNVFDVGDAIFFTADHPTGGGATELWKTDGTTQGTAHIKSFQGRGSPSQLTSFDGTLYFEVDEDIWKSDGTPEGTVQAVDRPGGQENGFSGVLTIGDSLYFTSRDTMTGNSALWSADATTGEVTRAADLTREFSSATDVDGVLFYMNGHELWKSDGTQHGTMLVADYWPDDTIEPHSLVDVAGTLFFYCQRPSHGARALAIRWHGTRNGSSDRCDPGA